MKRAIILLAAALLHAAAWAADDHLPKGYQLLYEQTFEKPESIKGFQMTDPAAWKYSKDEKSGGALELAARSKYKPEVRSPENIALIKEKTFGDFILEADLIQTGEEYGHRDMCLFFGHQAADQFYYVHLGKQADDHANQIFIVNKAARKKISKTSTRGTKWTDGWHHVKVVRKVKGGTIEVYFDDMKIL